MKKANCLYRKGASRILLLLLACSLFVTGNAPAAEKNAEKPADVPAILQRAVNTRDSAQAEARLDFDSIVDHFFNATLPQINEALASGQLKLAQPLPGILAGLNSGSPAGRMAAQALFAAETRKFVLYGVRSGSFAGKPLPQEQLNRLDGGLFLSFGKISTARKEFSPGRLIAQKGDSAKVSTNLFDRGSRQVYKVDLLLEKRGESWTVTAIDNAAELLAALRKETAGQ